MGEIIEKDVTDLSFHHMLRIYVGDFNNKKDGNSLRCNLVAVSNKYDLIFVAASTSLKVLKASQLDALMRSNGELGRKTRQQIKEFDFLWSLKSPNEIIHLSVNADNSLVSVCTIKNGGFVFAEIYDTRVFAKNPGILETPTPFQEVKLSVTLNSSLLDFSWNPNVESSKTFASCSTDGVSIFEVHPSEIKVIGFEGGSANGPSSTCVCWSPKGKQIVVGKDSGQVVQLTPQMVRKNVIDPCPDVKAAFNNLTVIDILWETPSTFFIVYKSKDNNFEQPWLVYVNTQGKETSYKLYEDVCFGSVASPIMKYQFIFLKQWNLILATSTTSSEFCLLGRDDNVWVKYNVEEGRPELLSNDDFSLNFPRGTTFTFNSTFEFNKDQQTHPPSLLLLTMSTDNCLLVYYLLNQNPSYVELNLKPEVLPAEVALRRAIAPPLSTSALPKQTPFGIIPLATTPANISKIELTPINNLSSISFANPSLGQQGTQLKPKQQWTSTLVKSPANAEESMLSASMIGQPFDQSTPQNLTAKSRLGGKTNVKGESILIERKPQVKPIDTTSPRKQSEVTASAAISMVMNGKDAQKDPYVKSIVEEINHFEQELKEVITKGSSFQINLGTQNDKEKLVYQTKCFVESINNVCLELLDLKKDIDSNRTETIELQATLERCKYIQERDNDPEYIALLRQRPLGSMRKNKLASIEAQLSYVDREISKVECVLDSQWQDYMDDKKKKRFLQPPKLHIIYETLSSNRVTMKKIKNRLQDVTRRIDNDPRVSRNRSLELSLMLANNCSLLSSGRHNLKKIPERKEAELREMLLNRRVIPIRSTAPKNLSCSRIVSAVQMKEFEAVKPSTKSPIAPLSPHSIKFPQHASEFKRSQHPTELQRSPQQIVPRMQQKKQALQHNQEQQPKPGFFEPSTPTGSFGMINMASTNEIKGNISGGEIHFKFENGSKRENERSSILPSIGQLISIPTFTKPESSTPFLNFSQMTLATDGNRVVSSRLIGPSDMSTTVSSISFTMASQMSKLVTSNALTSLQLSNVMSSSAPPPTSVSNSLEMLGDSSASKFGFPTFANMSLVSTPSTTIDPSSIQGKLSSSSTRPVNDSKQVEQKMPALTPQTDVLDTTQELNSNKVPAKETKNDKTMRLSEMGLGLFSVDELIDVITSDAEQDTLPFDHYGPPPKAEARPVTSALLQSDVALQKGGFVFKQGTSSSSSPPLASPTISTAGIFRNHKDLVEAGKDKAVQEPILDELNISNIFDFPATQQPQHQLNSNSANLDTTCAASTTKSFGSLGLFGQVQKQGQLTVIAPQAGSISSNPHPAVDEGSKTSVFSATVASTTAGAIRTATDAAGNADTLSGILSTTTSQSTFANDLKHVFCAISDATSVFSKPSLATTTPGITSQAAPTVSSVASVFGSHQIVTSTPSSDTTRSSNIGAVAAMVSFAPSQDDNINSAINLTCSAPGFGVVPNITSTAPLVFGAPSVFGAVSSLPSNFGVSSATPLTKSIFGAASTTTTSTPSLFGPFSTITSSGPVVFGIPTTNTSIFVAPSTAVSTTPSDFGVFSATSSAPPVFATPTISTTSIFGVPSAAGTTVPSVFGAASTMPGIFGAPPAVTQMNSVFGLPPSTTSVFGAVSSASIFGTPKASSVFGSSFQPTPSTFGNFSTSNQSFGTPSTAELFGAPANTSTSSFFGGGASISSPFGKSVFGQPAEPLKSILSPPTFGQSSTPAFSQGSVFGQVSPTSSGSGNFFDSFSLGGKPSAEKAATNVFGNPDVFGNNNQSQQSENIFGQSQASVFGSAKTNANIQGSFTGNNIGVGSTGFGGFQSSSNPGGFGTAPAFGSPIGAFGSSSGTFGGAPAFGSQTSSSFGSVTSRLFGSGDSGATSGFASIANSNAPSFGDLAQQSGGASFSGIAQQSGFGSFGNGERGFSGSGFQNQQKSSPQFTQFRS